MQSIRAKLDDSPSASWSYTHYFALVDACHDWGARPSEFGLCEREDDLAVMLAFSGTVAAMRSWERHLENEEMRKQEKKIAAASR